MLQQQQQQQQQREQHEAQKQQQQCEHPQQTSPQQEERQQQQQLQGQRQQQQQQQPPQVPPLQQQQQLQGGGAEPVPEHGESDPHGGADGDGAAVLKSARRKRRGRGNGLTERLKRPATADEVGLLASSEGCTGSEAVEATGNVDSADTIEPRTRLPSPAPPTPVMEGAEPAAAASASEAQSDGAAPGSHPSRGPTGGREGSTEPDVVGEEEGAAERIVFSAAKREEAMDVASEAHLSVTTGGAPRPFPASPVPTRQREETEAAAGAVAAPGGVEAPGSTSSPVPGEGEEVEMGPGGSGLPARGIGPGEAPAPDGAAEVEGESCADLLSAPPTPYTPASDPSTPNSS
ncbi:unnamed protein product [Lampetra fluviatilis]